MELRVLGPLEVLEDGQAVRLGGGKDRALLAALGVGRGAAMSVDALVDALWGESPPSSAVKQLQNLVLRLRKALGPDAIRTVPPGYGLGEKVELDAIWFESGLRDARAAAARGDMAESDSRFVAALGFWRGRPFEELGGWAPAEAEAGRLEELRRRGEEDEIDARLGCGVDTECVADLELMVSAEPLREHRWAQLMLALYASGRQGEALRAYQRARETLARELGIEPGRDLARLEEAMLAHAPELDQPSSPRSIPAAVGPLPSGVVTFLLTDIVGSTSLWERQPKAMADAVARHDVLIQGAVQAQGGVLLKARGEGDSTFSVFTRATDALAAALSAQRALVGEPWPESTPISVRMALHTGEAFERDGDYYGPTVNRAARVRSLAEGGQVLVSQATAGVVRDRLPDDADLVDLGPLALRDLERPERISGLAAPGLPDFPIWSAEDLEPAAALLTLPGVLRDSGRGVFVGRAAELEALVRAWKDASVGERRVVLVGGEPGIGKTRLAAELAQIVTKQGGGVLYGRCDEDLGIPYQPWVEALRHLVEHEPRDALVAHVAGYAGTLARLVPELASRVGGRAARESGDPEMERYLLFSAVTGVIARACQTRPRLLVLEDLHWADRPSLLLLRHLVASSDPSRLLVLGTYRPSDLGAEHPLTDLLAALHREHQVARIDLSGLSDSDIVALLEATAGQDVGDAGVALAQALSRETDGNPFFAGEILRHLSETGAISDDSAGQLAAHATLPEYGLPVSVREIIGHRVARLGEDTRRALGYASVIGRDFELDLLADLLDHDSDAVLDLMEPALAHSLVTDVAPGRFSFRHALIEHALYDDLSPTRRARGHAQVAAALETRLGDDPGARSGELAYHWALAPHGTDKAIRYAARAGDFALAQLAPDEAYRWYSRALELLEHHPSMEMSERVKVLVGLGDAQRQLGDTKYRATLIEAGQLAARRGDTDQLVRAALATNSGMSTVVGTFVPDIVAVIEAALAVTETEVSARRAKLLAVMAAEQNVQNPAAACALAGQAIELARMVGDEATLCWIAPRVEFARNNPQNLPERVAFNREVLTIAEHLGDPVLSLNAGMSARQALVEAGELEEADRLYPVLNELAERIGQPALRWINTYCEATRAILTGRLEEAEALALRAAAVLGQYQARATVRSRTGRVRGGLLYQLAGIRIMQGREAEIVEPLVQAMVDNAGLPSWRAALAGIYARLGADTEATEIIAADVADDFGAYPFDYTWTTSMYWLACTASDLELTDPAELLYARLTPFAAHLPYPGGSIWEIGHHSLGRLATAIGRYDAAATHFHAAAQAHEQLQAPYLLASTRLAWAEMLARRAHNDDLNRARDLAQQAATVATRSGYGSINRRATPLLAGLP